MRSFFALAAALALGACEQTPDYVLDTRAPLDNGGAGGAGGSGGASGTSGAGGAGGVGGTSGGLPECDPRVGAVVRFDGIEDCSYPLADMELHQLLGEHVYSQDPPPLNPFEAEQYADELCAFTEMITMEVVPWRYAVVLDGNLSREDFTTAVLCPRYCKALQLWLEEHRDLALECLP
jgi:hypothetical protein